MYTVEILTPTQSQIFCSQPNIAQVIDFRSFLHRLTENYLDENNVYLSYIVYMNNKILYTFSQQLDFFHWRSFKINIKKHVTIH